MDYTHLGRSGLSVSRLCLGTMNFGPETSEDDSHAIMDRAHRARHQLLRHRQRVRLEEGRGHHRADRRPVVRPGRRPPREDRHRHQALRLDERLAQRHVPVGAQHPARVRRVAAAAADRLHRPLPDAPRRPSTLRGTRSGRRSRSSRQQGKVLYVGSSNFAGWHIAKAHGDVARRGQHRPGQRAVDLQPARRVTSSSRCSRPARTTASASSRGPRCTAACSAASSARPSRASGASTGRAKDALKENRKAIKAYEDLCDELGEQPGRRRPRLAAAPAGGHRADHRPAHDGAARRRAAGAGGPARRRTCSPGSTRSSPAPAARPPRPTPGNPLARPVRPRMAGVRARCEAQEPRKVPARLPYVVNRAPRGVGAQTTEPTTTTSTSSASTASTTRRLVLGSMTSTL